MPIVLLLSWQRATSRSRWMLKSQVNKQRGSKKWNIKVINVIEQEADVVVFRI